MTSLTTLVYDMQVLEKNRMKPVWETLSGYFSTANILIASVILYYAQPDAHAYCLPIEPQNVSKYLTRAEFEFASSYCAAPLNQEYCILGACNLLFALAVPFISNLWLISPSVISGFRTFTEVRNQIERIGLTSDEMKEALQDGQALRENQPMNEKIESALCTIWSFKGRTDIWRCYILRSAVLCICLMGALAGYAYIDFVNQFFKNSHFNCTLEKSKIEPYEKYFCSYDMPRKVQPYFLVGNAILMCHLVCVIVGISFTATCLSLKDQSLYTGNFQSVRKMIQFMKMLWTRSGSVKSSEFLAFLNTTMPSSYLKESFRKSVFRDGLLPCWTVVKPYQSILSERCIIEAVYDEFNAREMNSSLKGKHDDLCAILGEITVLDSDWTEVGRKFASALVAKKQWRLFVNFIDCKFEEPSEGMLRQNIECSNFDLREVDTEGMSILYYAFDPRLRHFTAAKHILRCSSSELIVVQKNEEPIAATEYVLRWTNLAPQAKLLDILRLIEQHQEMLKMAVESERENDDEPLV